MMILPSLATAHEPVTIRCLSVYKEEWDKNNAFSFRVTLDVNETRAAGAPFLGLGAIHEETVAWTPAYLFVLTEAAIIKISRVTGLIDVFPPDADEVGGDSGTVGGCTNSGDRWTGLY